jgi:biotin carboxylase
MELLLIIGAGREQVPAYTLAKQKGYRVVGTDIDPSAPGFDVADFSLLCSTRDVEATLAAVTTFHQKHPIIGVMTIANDVPYTVSRVAEALGLPCAPSDCVQRLTDKLEMKARFQSADVTTPEFWLVESVEALTARAGLLNEGPFILKPSDGRGSRGVLYIDNRADLAWAFNHAMSVCANGRLILERFIVGPQLSVEGMFVDGQYYAVAYADRNYENMGETRPHIVEDGGVIPSQYEGPILEEVRDLIERGARALGLTFGSVKADIVLGKNGPEIIELAGRLSGNYLATHHIPMAYGVDLVGALIDVCMGKAITAKALIPSKQKYLGVRYFFPIAGVIESIEGIDEVAARDYVSMLHVYVSPGDTQLPIDKHGARAGTIICEGETYAEAKKRVEDAVRAIKFKVKVGPVSPPSLR